MKSSLVRKSQAIILVTSVFSLAESKVIQSNTDAALFWQSHGSRALNACIKK